MTRLLPLALILLALTPAALAQEDHGWHKEPEYRSGRAASVDLFLRARPADDANLLSIVPAGTAIELAICAQGWCPVKAGEQRGFVRYEEAYPEDGARPRTATHPALTPPAGAQVVHADERATITTRPIVQFVASKNSRVYHTPGCSHAGRIAEHNRVTYASAAEAEEDGKRPCRVCHPGD